MVSVSKKRIDRLHKLGSATRDGSRERDAFIAKLAAIREQASIDGGWEEVWKNINTPGTTIPMKKKAYEWLRKQSDENINFGNDWYDPVAAVPTGSPERITHDEYCKWWMRAASNKAATDHVASQGSRNGGNSSESEEENNNGNNGNNKGKRPREDDTLLFPTVTVGLSVNWRIGDARHRWVERGGTNILSSTFKIPRGLTEDCTLRIPQIAKYIQEQKEKEKTNEELEKVV